MVEVDPAKLNEARDVLLLRKQCQRYGVRYEDDWGVKKLEEALGVNHDPIGKDVSQRQEKANLQQQLADKGIYYDLRWNIANLKRALAGEKPKIKRRRKSVSKKKRKATNRKGKKAVGNRGRVPKEGAQAPEAADGQGVGETNSGSNETETPAQAQA
jgi:hypothetical protein